MSGATGNSGQGGRAAAASSHCCNSVRAGGRLIYYRRHLMVVPAIGIVVGDHDRGGSPGGLLLQEIDDVNDELLLVQGSGSVSILKTGRLQETDRGIVAAFTAA